MSVSALHELRRIGNLESIWLEMWRRDRRKSTTGIDGVTPAIFQEDYYVRLARISSKLRAGYSFSALRGLAIPKKDPSRFRLICVPTIDDRIVQRALLRVIEKRAQRLGILNDVSFAFVKDPGGQKRGVPGAHKLAIRLRNEASWTFKADIQSFFDSIERRPLYEEFSRSFGLRTLSSLVRGVIGCEIQSGDDRVRVAIKQSGIKRGVGLRQGMPLSPLLSNFVLRDFDKVIKAKYRMVRYADDLVVFSSTREDCINAQDLVKQELAKLGLSLSTEKSRIYEPDESLEFLGMEFRLRSSGSYGIFVSSEQLNTIKATFRSYHDLGFLNAQHLNAVTLLQRLQQMRAGYLLAYGSSDNFAALEQQTEQWLHQCLWRVYRSIFGVAAMSQLSAAKKQFLMLR